MYNHHLKKIAVVPVSQFNLSRKFNLNEDECKNIYIMPFKTTLDFKLRWLQYRITHNILPTNSWLCKIKMFDNNLCNICKQEEENINHIFSACEVINEFWDGIQENVSFIPTLTDFNKINGVYN